MDELYLAVKQEIVIYDRHRLTDYTKDYHHHQYLLNHYSLLKRKYLCTGLYTRTAHLTNKTTKFPN